MRRIIRIGIFAFFLFIFSGGISKVHAYKIYNFDSEINISRDTSIHVTEKIEVFFDTPKHGIIRTIPVIYRTSAKNVNSRVSDIIVTNEEGQKYPFTTSRSGNNLNLKIGDPDLTIKGGYTYRISYTAHNILQRYEGYDELYWNTVGTGWDTTIQSATATVYSPYAPVTKTICHSNCKVIQADENSWQVIASDPILPGSDLTFALGFDPASQLVFPDPRLTFWLDEGVWIALAVLPAVFMALAWWFRGRDYKFVDPNVYYQEAGALITRPGPFAREHLPMVYSPIKGLTPSEAGTLIDLKVDLADVVAEISELARLGFIKIHKFKVDRLLMPDKTDYIFVRTSKSDTSTLKAHQKYLLDNLFNSEFKPKLSDLEKHVGMKEIITSKATAAQLSKMSGKFYTDLAVFREKLYTSLTEEGFFGGRPDQLQAGGIMVAIIVSVGVTLIANYFSLSRMVWPWGIASGLIAVAFGFFMGHRTAMGHALYRQLVGLKYFVGKGKWRYEIAEKHLFLEEILPLAISLGVIGKLTGDMQDLQIEPPKYMGNLATMDFGSFGTSVGKTLAFTPSGSGSSGWSGGSGFSGGSSGGGFGGGGGGSW